MKGVRRGRGGGRGSGGVVGVESRGSISIEG